MINSQEDLTTNPQYYKHTYILTAEELGLNPIGNATLVQAIIDGVIDWIFQYTGLDIQYEHNEELDGTGKRNIMVKCYPCQQLLRVQVQSALSTWFDITRYCRILEHGEVMIEPSYLYWTFPEGIRNVRIRYIAGLTRIPPLLKMTVIELVQVLLAKQAILGAVYLDDNPEAAAAAQAQVEADNESGNSTKGIKSVSIKSLSVTFADDKRTLAESLTKWDVRKPIITRMIEDILKADNSYLKRLDQISKIYML